MDKLTTADYWDGTYAQASDAPLDISNFRSLGQRQVVEMIESVGLNGRILELGAGNSAVLCYLARMHPTAEFHGMDYAPGGCMKLRMRAAREQVNVEVHQADIFHLPIEHAGAYDRVFSLGLLEHFNDLPGVVRAQIRFLRPGGLSVTIIPNMAGVIGRLTRRFNPAVYALHVPHDLNSLVAGHRAAGAKVLRSGYLGSTNFGVLSSCFRGPDDRGWTAYKWLARLTTACWWWESRAFSLPVTRPFAPYIFVICQAAEAS